MQGMNPSRTQLEFPEVRVVEASAGSGKTFALARRYVQLVLDARASSHDLPIRTILAITFMKKASFEMKQRILLFLKRLALKTMPQDEAADILAPTGLDAEEAARRAFEVMEDVIRHYNFFQVQTIDSFINTLLSGCAFKIGLSARFQIRQNPREHLAASLDRLIEYALREPRLLTLFTDFLDQYLLLENKGSWFPKKDILGLLNALYHQQNSYGLDFITHPGAQNLVEQMAGVLKQMRRLQEIMPVKTHATFRKALEKFLAQYTTAFDFDRISDFFLKENFPATGGQEPPAEVQDLWEDIQSRLGVLAESEATQLFDPYVAVFRELMAEFQERCAREDILFMEEMNRKARDLFDEVGITVEELYYRLAMRFRHYMIDEFQDTSRLQWDNLAMMVEEALSVGGSLFYVGDKKQAIYGFRGGEVALFDQLQQDFQHFHVHPERLTKNYRSYEAVVNFNNAVFDLENLRRFVRAREEQDDGKPGRRQTAFALEDAEDQRLVSTFAHCAQEFRDDRHGGHVACWRIPGERRQDRDEAAHQQVMRLLEDLHQRFAWKDIAVLTRKNSEVEQVTGWLMEAGIPVKSERTVNMTENFVVQELMAFLTFLNSPIDDLAFGRVIQGEVFCAAAGLTPDQTRTFLFDLRLRDAARRGQGALYRDFREAFPAVWDRLIAPFFRSIGFYPVYELVISILTEWKVMDHFGNQCGFIMKFLEVIKRQEEDRCDLMSFLEYFEAMRPEEAFVDVAELDSVEVLTTHKSKGLEFKVVILPFAAMQIKPGTRGGSSGGELGQRSFMIHGTRAGMELLRIKEKYLGYSDRLYRIYRAQAVEALFSELNNVYVSLTRAREEMYILVPERSGAAFNILNLLIPEELFSDPQSGIRPPGPVNPYPLPAEAAPETSPGVTVLPVSRYRDWMDYLAEEFLPEHKTLQRRQRARRGERLHANLAAARAIEDLERLLESLPADSPEALMLAGVRQAPALQFLFDPGAEILTEQEIVDRHGFVRRLDRLIVYSNEVIVADYKSARSSEESDHAQVREYMVLLHELYPKHRVRGVLVYLDSLECEAVNQ